MEYNKYSQNSNITHQKALHPEKGKSGNGLPSHHQTIKAGSPVFDRKVYNKLPKVLQDLTSKIDDERKRDVLLLASITAVASVLPNINIKMVGKTIHPMLYTMIVAPSTSGKGLAPKARQLVESVDKYLKEQPISLNASAAESGGGNVNPPAGKRLFIPGNSSARAVYDAIARNDGAGLLFETEIDTLNIAKANEWGNFSDVQRKGFDHEEISLARKEENLEVAHPRFSVFLTGTDNQFVNFIRDPENGHFARYLFYTFEAKPEWISQKPTKKDVELDRMVERVQGEILDLFKILSQRKQALEFEMTDDLWDLHTQRFGQITRELEDQDAPWHIHAFTRRVGVQATRMACIFAMLNHCGNDFCLSNKQKLHAKKSHVEAAIQIAIDSISHAWVLASMLDSPSEATMKRNPTKQKWYNALDDSFETHEAEAMARSLNVTDRTARNWLKDEGLFKKNGHGSYMKKL